MVNLERKAWQRQVEKLEQQAKAVPMNVVVSEHALLHDLERVKK